MAGRLDGKVAIITGAGSGLGEASAKRFAQEGAAVVCADWALDGAERVAKEITADGGRAIPFHVDVQSLEQTEAMAKAALDEYGTIDVMFANAGIAATGTAMDCEPEMWDRAIGVMLTGVWHSMRAALPTMVEKGSGSLINTASVGGIIGVPGIFPYAAAKAGVIGMTRQAAVEFGPKGIRVNAIAPGSAPTPLVVATYEKGAGSGGTYDTIEEGLANAAKKYPMGRLGEPIDIANVALFLASDESVWVTGTVSVVDGGFSIA